MKSILISITSYNHNKYLDQVIREYVETYKDYKLKFILSVNYQYQPKYPNVDIIPSIYTMFSHAWQNKKFIRDSFQRYDFIIESDDDILVPLSTFENYCQNIVSCPIDTIPGVYSAETRVDEGMTEIFILTSVTRRPITKEPKLTIGGRQFYVPDYKHAACFIADKERYAYALLKGLSIDPSHDLGYHPQEWARTQIYNILKEVIPVDGVEQSLVYHLPNKYVNQRRNDFRSLTRHNAELLNYQ